MLQGTLSTAEETSYVSKCQTNVLTKKDYSVLPYFIYNINYSFNYLSQISNSLSTFTAVYQF